MELSRRFGWSCLLWLLVAMAWGALLRWTGVSPVEGFNYRFGLHTHSHLALLGWVAMGFIVLLAKRFLLVGRRRSVAALFAAMQLCLVVMLFSYPVQGYGPISIAASTLYVFGTYLFCWWLYRDVVDESRRTVRLLARSAAVFLAVSSLGPYGVGYFKATGFEGSPHYYNALYFYLHFLYNGFFVSGLLAIVFSSLPCRFFARLPVFEVDLLLVGTGASYFLSVLWVGPDPLFYGLAGAALQLAVFGRWLWEIERLWEGTLSLVTRGVLWLLLAKFFMQLVSAFPEVARWLFASQSYTIIGYIHFVMLGILTPFLFVGLLPEAARHRLFRFAAGFYALGFVSTECLLFGAGIWAGLRAAIPFPLSLFAGYMTLLVGSVLAVLLALASGKGKSPSILDTPR